MPNWLNAPPSKYNIVTCYFPETKPKPRKSLRPCLVLGVSASKTSNKYLIHVAFGTGSIKFDARKHVDLIIQNSTDLDEHNLSKATRFDLDPKQMARLPWNKEFFGCWSGFKSPIIARLTETYQREMAHSMMNRIEARQQLELKND